MEPENTEVAQFTITVADQPIEMEMKLPTLPVTAKRLLPVIQKMSDSFVKVGEDGIKTQGKEISCKKGCGACCCHLVPVGEMEAHNIADLIKKMPEPKRSNIVKKFSDAVEHFQKNGWLEKLNTLNSMSNQERLDLATEFFYEGVSCPLLEDGACSIHKDRPLVCREYLVTTPAENCSDPANNPIDRVFFPTALSTPLRDLGKNPEIKASPPFLPLMLSLVWAERFPESSEEKPGKDWMNEFLSYIEQYEKNKKNGLKD